MSFVTMIPILFFYLDGLITILTDQASIRIASEGLNFRAFLAG
jgi:hypothetical protein